MAEIVISEIRTVVSVSRQNLNDIKRLNTSIGNVATNIRSAIFVECTPDINEEVAPLDSTCGFKVETSVSDAVGEVIFRCDRQPCSTTGNCAAAGQLLIAKLVDASNNLHKAHESLLSNRPDNRA